VPKKRNVVELKKDQARADGKGEHAAGQKKQDDRLHQRLIDHEIVAEQHMHPIG